MSKTKIKSISHFTLSTIGFFLAVTYVLGGGSGPVINFANSISIFILCWFLTYLFYCSLLKESLISIIGFYVFLISFFALWLSFFEQVYLAQEQILILLTFLLLPGLLVELVFDIKNNIKTMSERILLVGYSDRLEDIINSIKGRLGKGKIVGIVDNNMSKGKEVLGIPFLGKIIDLEQIVKENNIQAIIQTGHFEQAFNMIVFSRANHLTYRSCDPSSLFYGSSFNEEDWGLLKTFKLETTPLAGFNLILKRIIDILGSIILIIILLPILLLVAILLKLEDLGAPIIVKEDRHSDSKRKSFGMFRFRTLPRGEDEKINKYSFKELTENLKDIREDKRATKLGRILRTTYISELPQLFNVFLGQMSLVGPRPAYCAEIQEYSDSMKKRLLVKPGMTGLWQIHRKGRFSFDDMFSQDSFYVENWSLKLDAIIVLKTLIKILKFRRKSS